LKTSAPCVAASVPRGLVSPAYSVGTGARVAFSFALAELPLVVHAAKISAFAKIIKKIFLIICTFYFIVFTDNNNRHRLPLTS
jgi:hypothetical protein